MYCGIGKLRYISCIYHHIGIAALTVEVTYIEWIVQFDVLVYSSFQLFVSPYFLVCYRIRFPL